MVIFHSFVSLPEGMNLKNGKIFQAGLASTIRIVILLS
jgi:hypothetical protein